MAPKTKYLYSINIYSLTEVVFTAKVLLSLLQTHIHLVIPWNLVSYARCLIRGGMGQETGTKYSHTDGTDKPHMLLP